MLLLLVSDQQLKAPSSTFVPEKRILELVLDTLQRCLIGFITIMLQFKDLNSLLWFKYNILFWLIQYL